ncbi:stimulus-sensing domain-containing protein [Gluconobacter wancherniae]|uniref:histidine kinase n=1 Tax=Gluconobacter wancherniae NBRC 103581 TaxID=656744 RepID=A0A511B2P4_9PROT|nr:stimulus-sensing domain-containing protein [Gluconobacter wancherniae]MBF0854244.1 HAMP domain-containing protein [Gluconobacter wancherniae]MBS1062637.1 stimulus-sensing domain-containing protein [Gluconobacter wancherniae]MBS1088626.1 stimulus-sensing domain-containing protein [Gluconobacter wancherniae]GBD57302.1 histidine kinase [Gluconobacter wancherniae NBRC 103581]GEK93923.1 histidine kinase [Gluconobacter wancherniae NBRC 103581]
MADRPPSPVPALHVSPEEARQHRHIRRRAGFLRLWLAPLLRAIQRRGQRFPKASVAFSRERLLSPLLIRILLLNALPLALLAVTLLFLNQFQNSLLETDVNTLREQAHIYAGALGQSAVREAPKTAGHSLPGDDLMLDTALARRLLMSLTEPSPNAHARLFDPDGKLVADSRGLPHHVHGASDVQAVAPNDPIDADGAWHPPRNNVLETFYDWLLSLLPLASSGDISTLDTPVSDADGPNDAQPLKAQSELPPFIRRTADRQLVITVVEPVIHDGQTVGEIQLTRHAPEVDRSLFAVRSSILSLVLVALSVTVLLSWYLSLTIARPLLTLARASHDMSASDSGRTDLVPERLLARRDEIGGLARALRGSALALWARMDDIERFAADVSHEIKNPLSSIRSAIETLPRIENIERRDRLLGIIGSDVRRLDRLISDISDASRIDAELSRARPEPVAVVALLSILAEMHQTTRKPEDPILRMDVREQTPPLRALAVEDRLVQVLRNLIGNAVSFSPEKGVIALHASAREVAGSGPGTGSVVEITISDQGPGIPPGKLESIFDRFYSERPHTENFGQHSGLGLAISRQIISALRGNLFAENIMDASGVIKGACFVVRLPRAP